MYLSVQVIRAPVIMWHKWKVDKSATLLLNFLKAQTQTSNPQTPILKPKTTLPKPQTLILKVCHFTYFITCTIFTVPFLPVSIYRAPYLSAESKRKTTMILNSKYCSGNLQQEIICERCLSYTVSLRS